MNIRLDFWCSLGATPRVNLDLGDAFELTQRLNATEPVEWQELLTALSNNDVAGVDINGEDIHVTLKGV